jgi:hypothetical protein
MLYGLRRQQVHFTGIDHVPIHSKYIYINVYGRATAKGIFRDKETASDGHLKVIAG